jgi:uncharacterized protein DUF4349
MRTRFVWWAIVVLVGVLVIAAVSIPNLLRSRQAADMAHYSGQSRLPVEAKLLQIAEDKSEVLGDTDIKIVRTVSLDLFCRDVGDSLRTIRSVVASSGGFVENADFTQASDGSRTGKLSVRVPAAQLDQTLEQLKRTAVRVEHETVQAQDVTRHYVDTEARLRNYHAEEQQYLAIMKRSGSMKDTLAVAEKLADVRGRIEQIQGELNYLSRQAEMATVAVSVWQQPSAAAGWRPVENARRAWNDMIAALASYADSMIAFLVWLPVIFLWGATVAMLSLIGWKLFRWAQRRFAPVPTAVK